MLFEIIRKLEVNISIIALELEKFLKNSYHQFLKILPNNTLKMKLLENGTLTCSKI